MAKAGNRHLSKRCSDDGSAGWPKLLRGPGTFYARLGQRRIFLKNVWETVYASSIPPISQRKRSTAKSYAIGGIRV